MFNIWYYIDCVQNIIHFISYPTHYAVTALLKLETVENRILFSSKNDNMSGYYVNNIRIL